MAAEFKDRPVRCTYIVRFWMLGIGFGRQERDADNALVAGAEVYEIITKRYPKTEVVVIGIVRK